MSRSPRWPTEDDGAGARPQAPAETGQRLASLPRPNNFGQAEELRVSLDSYEGHPYISVRLWTQDRTSGEWWPTRKGCSIRMGEAAEVAKALQAATRLVDRPEKSRSERQTAAGARGRGPMSTRSLDDLPEARGTGRGFNEFD